MSVSTVRTIIADPELYDRAVATGDGVTVEFQVPYYPVVEGSIKVYVDGELIDADYTVDHAVGLVRFNVAPAKGAGVAITYKHTTLSDAQIQAFLDLNGNDVRLAAADALDTIASNEALVQKRIKLLDLSTDGPAVAKELREHAARLRAAVDSEVAVDFAEMAHDEFAEREIIWKDALRTNG